LAGHHDVEAREEIRQRVLQSKSHGKAADTQCRQNRRNGNAELVQHNQQAEHDDGYASYILRQAGNLEAAVQACAVAPNHKARESCRNDCKRGDPQYEKDLTKETGMTWRECRSLRGEVYCQHDEPDCGRLTNRFHG
jgi:hypothetical protein